ncbi:ABC transporter [Ophiocordyceps sinensis CO18]|uniref:ABC transporter n=1 Tax=Ophiocordyceps sinensis (strain Co18 / CGMCC 3.14243) TaxID=911162 RepID=T5AKS0_OPHSC|nr:ABC transporter [Ophiocordyceps sinensis CO18]
MAAPDCLNDSSFGPAVVGCRHDFDLTKLFEQAMLSIAPSSAFAVLAVLRTAHLRRRPVVLQGAWSFQQAKLAAIGGYLCLQMALLVTACIPPRQEPTRIPAAALSLIAAVLVLVVSVFEHARTVKPSALLGVYLFFTLLFDVAQSRNQWLSSRNDAFTKLFTASVALKLAVLLVEAQSKARWAMEPRVHAHNPEATSSIFNRSVFFWLNDLLFRGYRKRLAADDLYTLDESLLADNYRGKFWDELERRRSTPVAKGKGTGRALFRAMAVVLKWPFLTPILPRLAVTAFSFAQPFFINAVLRHVKTDTAKASADVGYGFIGAAVVIYTGIAVSTGLYWYFHQRALVRLRACLVTAIYRKTVHKRASDMSAITLMDADVGRIQSGIRDLHECWASILETGMASWLLYRQIGVAFVAPVVVILACTGLTMVVARFAGKRQRHWMELLQRRVALSSAIVPCLPAIKMSGLSHQVGCLVQKCREDEIQGAKRFRVVTTVSTVVAFAPVLLSPVVTFALSSDSLNIETGFTALSWINLLCQPLTQLFQSVPQLLAALTCLDRVEGFLASASHHDCESTVENMSDKTSQDCPGLRITVHDGRFGWDESIPVLENVGLSIPTSALTVVTGAMAAGKSTLCRALLRETPFSQGTVLWRNDTTQVAYCDQDPFLFNATIRENIIGFGSYDVPWYQEVVQACQLSSDISALPRGHKTVVGTKGLALSGGQRKRICLARALYSRPAVAILDDVLSGIDSTTQGLIVRHVFGPHGIFPRLGTTVVLATQPTRHLELADWIVLLGDNKVQYQGSFADLDASKHGILNGLLSGTALPSPDQPPLCAAQKSENGGPGLEATSGGDGANYRSYFEAIGRVMLLPLVLVGVAFAFTYNFSTAWLEFWQSSRFGPDRLSLYLGTYFALQFVCLGLLAAFFGYNGNVMGPRASQRLHLRALCVLLRAPLEYYTTVDAAVSTGYFSQDMSIAALIPVAAPYVLVGYPVVLAVLYFVQKFYLRTSTQLRALMLETREPLYKHFTETIDGLVTMRAFGWVSANLALNAKLLDQSQRPAYLLAILQQWLSMVLNLCVAALAVLFVALATQLRTSAGFTAIGLVSLMSIGEMMGNLVRCYSELQTATVALGRLRTFEDGVAAESSGQQQPTTPDQWPDAGRVEFERVSASYNSDFSFPGNKTTDIRGRALQDVSLSIGPGERVLVCGRTGSGKSTLLLLLQNFLKPSTGRVLIDNVETSEVACAALRNRVIGLPQFPFFLPERCSIRENLEYHGTDSELTTETYQQKNPLAPQNHECEYALRAVGLWDMVEARGGLDGKLDNDALSGGEKQLFSLARAIVRLKLRRGFDAINSTRGGVLLLDEFNTGLDVTTERSMWGVIEREFLHYTIICVAHELQGAFKYGKVVTLSHGEVVKVGESDDI